MKKTINILSVKISTLNFQDTLLKISEFLSSKKLHYIVTPNPEILILANKNSKLKRIINNSNLNCPDGAGLLWAAKYLQLPLSKLNFFKQIEAFWQMVYSLIIFAVYPKYANIISERVTGTDLVPEIAKICSKMNKYIFFLGAAPGVAQETANRLKLLYPNLKIAGTSANDYLEMYDDINCRMINKSKTDCLMIAYGAPNDQLWLNRNKDKLKHVKLIIGVGGAFDFIAGSVSLHGGQKAIRAPHWIRKIHLEWLHRLIYQPNRISRIFKATIIFPLMVFRSKINPTK